jgi:hypothetical protein
LLPLLKQLLLLLLPMLLHELLVFQLRISQRRWLKQLCNQMLTSSNNRHWWLLSSSICFLF